MERKITNKLVRDKIPLIMIKEGQNFHAGVIEGPDLERALALKLKEEAQEVLDAVLEYQKEDGGINTYNIECELGDLIEVILSLMKLYHISSKEIKKIMKEKKEERGGFKEGIYLEWIEEEESQ